tara:strand:+ start:5281 stop:6759 length:1479 start_codon:yes stop_codon:yes gene_type:complete
MMKKYISITIVFITLAFMTGCDDVLEENPTGFISPEQFYNTEKDALIAVTGQYARLTDDDLYGRDLEMMTIVGDPSVTPNRVISNPTARYDYTSTFGDISDIWRNFYILIGDANKAIGRLEASDLSQDVKDQFIGEALFLRAYSYYTLQQLFGDVPLWVGEITDNAAEIAALPRTPVAEVRAQIIADLLIAENSLPPSYDRGYDKQRATKWAAKSLLAKTYLYQEDWAKAEAAAADVINNSDHALLNEYKDVFTEENEFSEEIIFTLDFQIEIKITSRGRRYGIRTRDELRENRESWMSGFGFNTVRQSFVNTYDPADERLEGLVFDKNLAGDQLNMIYMQKHQRTNDIQDKDGINFIIFRLADILLVHAEAANQNNNMTGAEISLNKVRFRANVPDITGLSKDGLRDAIRQERLWELVGENHGKLDRMRWRTLVVDVQAVYLSAIAAGEPAGPVEMARIMGVNIADKHLLLPIPDAEFQKNPTLGEQNTGW